jgi:hypothetical protein
MAAKLRRRFRFRSERRDAMGRAKPRTRARARPRISQKAHLAAFYSDCYRAASAGTAVAYVKLIIQDGTAERACELGRGR